MVEWMQIKMAIIPFAPYRLFIVKIYDINLIHIFIFLGWNNYSDHAAVFLSFMKKLNK